MKYLRRVVWYAVTRLLVLCLVLGLVITAFYYGMNLANIQIILKDGMANRAKVIMGMSSDGGMQKLNAKVPLAELANYSTALSSITGSRASFTMKFASYELVPQNVQDELIAANQESEE